MYRTQYFQGDVSTTSDGAAIPSRQSPSASNYTPLCTNFKASINPRPAEPSLRLEQPSPITPQIHSDYSPAGALTRSTPSVENPFSSLESQTPMPDPQNHKYVKWRRQKMIS